MTDEEIISEYYEFYSTPKIHPSKRYLSFRKGELEKVAALETELAEARKREAEANSDSKIADDNLNAMSIRLNRMTALVDQWSEIATDRQAAIEKYKSELSDLRRQLAALQPQPAPSPADTERVREMFEDIVDADCEMFNFSLDKHANSDVYMGDEAKFVWLGFLAGYRAHAAATASLHTLADMAAGLLKENAQYKEFYDSGKGR